MRIFLLSDTHDDVEAAAKACDYIADKGADLVLHLGDMCLRRAPPAVHKALWEQRSTEEFYRYFKQEFFPALQRTTDETLQGHKSALDGTGIPYKVIPGNYDPTLDSIFSEHDLHKKTADIDGIRFFGYGGATMMPVHLEAAIQFKQMAPFHERELLHLAGEAMPDIAVLHQPPNRLGDTNFEGVTGGSRAALHLAMEYAPKIILAGHIHEAGPLANNPGNINGVTPIQRPDGGYTWIVNPGNLGRFAFVDKRTLETRTDMGELPYGTFARIELSDDGRLLACTQYRLDTDDRSVGDVREIRTITP